MSYEVVHEDLASASRTFRTEGTTGEDTWASPLGSASSGDAACDDTITSLMHTFEILGTTLAESIEGHGDKLASAADDYESVDADSALLYDSLLERLEGK